MKKNLFALATVTAMAFSAPAFAQSSANQGFDMLTGSLYNTFTQMGIPIDGIMNLSLSQVAQIKDLLDGDEPEGQKKQRIKAVLAR